MYFLTFVLYNCDYIRIFSVVLWSTRTLFVITTLHERAVHWSLYCGNDIKVACLWIKGKTTASGLNSAWKPCTLYSALSSSVYLYKILHDKWSCRRNGTQLP